MRTENDLKTTLRRIDGKGYKAYKDIKGQYDFGTYTLIIDHVQGDPFANVRGSEEWGVEPWVGALIRATDKIRRLQKFARVGKLANEAVEDSFRDLAVYAIIALVLYEEPQEVENAKQEAE
ncbi:hypothetical protein LCGC14_2528550 [marine sediment metagenome]|uniref:ATPase of the ABC class N-terminal domain-containing protein n=1 Tax=marine sediment metagenome TaxID=412755 RepID=A0A0F9AU89_9ZZZZ